jgi:hypothetical protein
MNWPHLGLPFAGSGARDAPLSGGEKGGEGGTICSDSTRVGGGRAKPSLHCPRTWDSSPHGAPSVTAGAAATSAAGRCTGSTPTAPSFCHSGCRGGSCSPRTLTTQSGRRRRRSPRTGRTGCWPPGSRWSTRRARPRITPARRGRGRWSTPRRNGGDAPPAISSAGSCASCTSPMRPK